VICRLAGWHRNKIVAARSVREIHPDRDGRFEDAEMVLVRLAGRTQSPAMLAAVAAAIMTSGRDS